ncbi:hypothetical protein ACKF11_13475 [Methylobacillus sp. Pita2]|uniref:hypothetical protein n=1 Tax=Methylobacillus sp. Pita2 TaxID=3383245 RepID=UPI0038B5A202
MKLSNPQSKVLLFASMAALLAFPVAASAASLGDIANNITNSLQGVGGLAGAIGYVAAFFLLLAAIFKFKQHGENAEHHPIKTPIMLFACAVLCAYMTSVLSTGGQTIFAGDRQSQGSRGESLRVQ